MNSLEYTLSLLFVSAVAGFLGSLEYVLEEGPQNDWFEDTSIMICAVVCEVV